MQDMSDLLKSLSIIASQPRGHRGSLVIWPAAYHILLTFVTCPIWWVTLSFNRRTRAQVKHNNGPPSEERLGKLDLGSVWTFPGSGFWGQQAPLDSSWRALLGHANAGTARTLEIIIGESHSLAVMASQILEFAIVASWLKGGFSLNTSRFPVAVQGGVIDAEESAILR
ncbi:hypothetical protein VTO42DRAFT_1156 [Malbranchea cinnamomea]